MSANHSVGNVNAWQEFSSVIGFDIEKFLKDFDGITIWDVANGIAINDDMRGALYARLKDIIDSAKRPKGMGKREWQRLVTDASKQVDDFCGKTSALAKGLKALPYITVGIDALVGMHENIANGENKTEIISDAVIDVGLGTATTLLSSVISGAISGAVAGSVAPGVGNLIGLGAGMSIGFLSYLGTEVIKINGKTISQHLDDAF